MFAKLFNKQSSDSQKSGIELNPQVVIHYGIPSTTSRLAYDPIQQLLAVGTLDGRIKVIGQDNIEGLLTSLKELPFKNLEFLQNQGFLISISNENNVQVWDLENRCIASSLQWESNITAFSVLQETNYMHVGDESGLVSVLKYEVGERKLLRQPYSIPAHLISEAAGIPLLNNQSVVGVLPQPCSNGNRVLFVYGNGVMVLWDVSKNQILFFRGNNNHQTEDGPADNSVEQEDKEIISICWASSDGSILAAGYVDGDIMLWNLSDVAITKDQKAGKPTNDMVKLQLSPVNKRFPVIVLQWSPCGLQSDHGGLLFVYGGDEIGSAEVLTILRLEWSPRRDTLKNVMRVNISLEGSFADMILLQNFSVLENTEAPSLFLLSSPGQLQYYDSSCLSRLISQQNKSGITPIHYRSAVTTTEPYMTIGKLILVHGHIKYSAALSAMASAAEVDQGSILSSDKTSRWPLNGGVPCHFPSPKERVIERLYLAGYQDGSARIWDATYPVLSPLHFLDPEVKGMTIDSANASVCALDFSSETLSIAVGDISGMIRLYHLSRNCNETGFHVVTETKSEVCSLDQGNRSLLSAVFMLSTSPVCTLKYTNLGARLAIGYESGQVAMLNVNNFSVLFLINSRPSPCSPVVSFTPAIVLDACGLTRSMDQSEPQMQSDTSIELVFALRSDLHVDALNISSGSVVWSFPQHRKESTAISVYILEGAMCVTEVAGGNYVSTLSQEDEAEAGPALLSGHDEGGFDIVDRSTNFMHSSDDLQILVCCTDVLQMYSLKSLIQGHADSLREVNLLKNSCWTATFKKDEKECGLIVLYQSGSIEIRSLPNLEVLGEVSLMSILRWNFKTNMEKTMSCTEHGHISLVNGCEFAVLSLLACENYFRIRQSLPQLYDKALAAALDLNFSLYPNSNKESPSGIFSGIMKGLRASKETQPTEPVQDQKSIWSSLDNIFSRPSADPSPASKEADKVVELKIDDIDIDGPLRFSPIYQKNENKTKDKKTERKELFEGGGSDTKPRQRTVDEIKSKYRNAGDTSNAATSAASAASQARDKLLERKEKLERISQNSEELRNGAENFASMAKELAKRMENRKWWQI